MLKCSIAYTKWNLGDRKIISNSYYNLLWNIEAPNTLLLLPASLAIPAVVSLVLRSQHQPDSRPWQYYTVRILDHSKLPLYVNRISLNTFWALLKQPKIFLYLNKVRTVWLKCSKGNLWALWYVSQKICGILRTAPKCIRSATKHN
jgi:hypothetical protein